MSTRHLVEDGSLVQQSVIDSKESMAGILCIHKNRKEWTDFSKVGFLHVP